MCGKVSFSCTCVALCHLAVHGEDMSVSVCGTVSFSSTCVALCRLAVHGDDMYVSVWHCVI